MTPPANSFATTRWTRVVAARGDSPEAQQALSDLCALNYAPVLRFLRATGHAPDDARELTHEFFANVLEHRSLEGVDPSRGRFRTYLLGALKHFIASRRVHGARLKRGGGLEPLPLDAGTETHHGPVPAALRTEAPEALFDREWALGVVERALATVEQESIAAGAREVFDGLKPWLSAGATPGSQADVAVQLGMSEGAVKVAIHRLRKRFREAVRHDVAQTVQGESELAAEMQHLIAALSA
jgi:DNA-directed RNA polymerase specialized sigma24 family protein